MAYAKNCHLRSRGRVMGNTDELMHSDFFGKETYGKGRLDKDAELSGEPIEENINPREHIEEDINDLASDEVENINSMELTEESISKLKDIDKNDYFSQADTVRFDAVNESVDLQMHIDDEFNKKESHTTVHEQITDAVRNESVSSKKQASDESMIWMIADWAANVDMEKKKKQAKNALASMNAVVSKMKAYTKSMFNKAKTFYLLKNADHYSRQVEKRFADAPIRKARVYRMKCASDEIYLWSVRCREHIDTLKIPSIVANRPITSIRPGFMTNQDVRIVILPKYLEVLQKQTFTNNRLIEVIIITNVKEIMIDAFYRTEPKMIIFLCPAPAGLRYSGISKDTKIFCKREYASSFVGVNNVHIYK